MRADQDRFVLASGRAFYAYGLRLGIGPTPREGRLRITYGSDGDVEADEPDYVDGGDRVAAFTPEERCEIAAYVIDLWTRWATRS